MEGTLRQSLKNFLNFSSAYVEDMSEKKGIIETKGVPTA